MKRFMIPTLAILLFFFSVPTYAFNCSKDGKNLVYEGLHKYQILAKCGPPASKEVVTIEEKGGSYRKIEEWLYIVDVYGHWQMYLIRFDEKGIAREIEWLGEQK